jgi:hypothetical protein
VDYIVNEYRLQPGHRPDRVARMIRVWESIFGKLDDADYCETPARCTN